MEVLRARRQTADAARSDTFTAAASDQSARAVGTIELHIIGGGRRFISPVFNRQRQSGRTEFVHWP